MNDCHGTSRESMRPEWTSRPYLAKDGRHYQKTLVLSPSLVQSASWVDLRYPGTSQTREPKTDQTSKFQPGIWP